MRTRLAVILVTGVVIVLVCAACDKIFPSKDKTVSDKGSPPPPPTTAETSTRKEFRAPSIDEYYRMLKSGYRSPRHNVRSDGYAGSGTAPRRSLDEMEGDALKRKIAEGKKAAEGGKGKEPEIPPYIKDDDGGKFPDYRDDD